MTRTRLAQWTASLACSADSCIVRALASGNILYQRKIHMFFFHMCSGIIFLFYWEELLTFLVDTSISYYLNICQELMALRSYTFFYNRVSSITVIFRSSIYKETYIKIHNSEAAYIYPIYLLGYQLHLHLYIRIIKIINTRLSAWWLSRNMKLCTIKLLLRFTWHHFTHVLWWYCYREDQVLLWFRGCPCLTTSTIIFLLQQLLLFS